MYCCRIVQVLEKMGNLNFIRFCCTVMGTYSNRWFTITGIEIGVNEPIYTLREMPTYDYFRTIGENDLNKVIIKQQLLICK